MEYILKNGIVYDPTNNVTGEKKDVMIKDGKIVESWYEVDMLSMIQQLNGTKQ